MNNAFKVQHQLKNEMLVNVKKREGRIWGRERERAMVLCLPKLQAEGEKRKERLLQIYKHKKKFEF